MVVSVAAVRRFLVRGDSAAARFVTAASSGRYDPRAGAVRFGEQHLATAVLVIGTGGSGLRAAIRSAERGVDVRLVGERPGSGARSTLAAGGIDAALGTVDPADSWQQHAADRLTEGCFLGIPAACGSSPRTRPRGSPTWNDGLAWRTGGSRHGSCWPPAPPRPGPVRGPGRWRCSRGVAPAPAWCSCGVRRDRAA
ncbi:FAD-binding protein [Actinocatenispora comari]|uniref:FAD-binding protein n=1 Tax=Actinocatenispora comari TaxID=2807577 RepID=UPI001A928FCB